MHYHCMTAVKPLVVNKQLFVWKHYEHISIFCAWILDHVAFKNVEFNLYMESWLEKQCPSVLLSGLVMEVISPSKWCIWTPEFERNSSSSRCHGWRRRLRFEHILRRSSWNFMNSGSLTAQSIFISEFLPDSNVCATLLYRASEFNSEAFEKELTRFSKPTSPSLFLSELLLSGVSKNVPRIPFHTSMLLSSMPSYENTWMFWTPKAAQFFTRLL